MARLPGSCADTVYRSIARRIRRGDLRFRLRPGASLGATGEFTWRGRVRDLIATEDLGVHAERGPEDEAIRVLSVSLARRFLRAAALEALRLKVRASRDLPEAALQWGFITRRIAVMKHYAAPRYHMAEDDEGDLALRADATYNFQQALGGLALHYDALRAEGYGP